MRELLRAVARPFCTGGRRPKQFMELPVKCSPNIGRRSSTGIPAIRFSLALDDGTASHVARSKHIFWFRSSTSKPSMPWLASYMCRFHGPRPACRTMHEDSHAGIPLRPSAWRKSRRAQRRPNAEEPWLVRSGGTLSQKWLRKDCDDEDCPGYPTWHHIPRPNPLRRAVLVDVIHVLVDGYVETGVF